MKLFPNFTRHHLITHTNFILIFHLVLHRNHFYTVPQELSFKSLNQCLNKRNDDDDVDDDDNENDL